jgi:lysyl-tRNA synthetase class 2
VTERDDLREPREHKLEQLRSLGLPLLPTRFGATRPSSDIRADFSALEGSRVRVAGRLLRVRLMGKAAFAHLLDRSGELQLYFKLDVLGQQLFEYFKLLDLGDIIGVEGAVFKTRTGEVSVQVENLVLLAKAYLPLPEKFHGLTDVETRYRQRYLDLISNPEARRVFQLRTDVVRGLRRYLDGRGFVEVETPVLQPQYGGAAANPFVTHSMSLDADLYLRIATELYLKRLIIGGMERVYEIGKDFRNEGVSWKHSNEFTMIEFYMAYVDYQDIMMMLEDMVSSVAREVLDGTVINFNGHEIDLKPPWNRITVEEAVLQHADIDLRQVRDAESLIRAARGAGVEVMDGTLWGEIVEEIVGTLVEPHMVQPTILYDFPIDFPGSLLAKRKPDRPDLAERFEAYIGTVELANAFTELNEAGDQLERMQALAAEGDEHQAVDWDFIRALEHGMPPTGGIGFGIDRLVMMLAGAHNVRETILFPQLRTREAISAEP